MQETTTTPRIAVVYHSVTGTVEMIAQTLAEAAGEAGAEVRLRPVGDDRIVGPPARVEDVLWADGVLLGTPVRFGAMTAELKAFLDGLGPQWRRGLLADKVYSAFCSGATPHGGLESTLLAMHTVICHLGGIVVPPGYCEPAKYADGNPYGTCHASGRIGGAIDSVTFAAAAVQARRVVAVARALRVAGAMTVAA